MSDVNNNDVMNGSFNGKQLIGGTFNGKVIYGNVDTYVLKGTITDNVTNGILIETYQVSGSQGDTGTFNLAISAELGYQFTQTTSVTFTGLGSAITAPATCSLSADSITLTCVMSYTLPNTGYNAMNEIVDNFVVTAAAVKAPEQFQCDDWTGYTTNVSSGGVVQITNSGTAAATTVLTDTCSENTGCSPVSGCSATVLVQVPNHPSTWTNPGQNITCQTTTLTVPVGKDSFVDSDDWTGSASWNSSGEVTGITNGNLSGITSTGVSAFEGCGNRSATGNITGTVNDSDLCNDGESVTFSYTATQPGSGTALVVLTPSPTISATGTVSGITYNENLTNTSYTTTPSTIQDNTCDDCCNEILYSFNFTGTIPDTFCNGGAWTAQTSVSQPAGGNNLDSNADWDGVINVLSSGTVTVSEGSLLSNIVIKGNGACTGTYDSNAATNTLSCPSKSGDCNNDTEIRSFSVSGMVEPDDSEFCNAGENTSFTSTANQVGGSSPLMVTCSDFSVSQVGVINKPFTWIDTDPEGFSGSKQVQQVTFTYEGTIPNTYCNGGLDISGTCTLTKPANVANTISVDETLLNFFASGDDVYTVNVTVEGTDEDNYTVSANEDWVNLTMDGTTVDVEVEPNGDDFIRLATITYTHGTDSTQTATTTVTQTASFQNEEF